MWEQTRIHLESSMPDGSSKRFRRRTLNSFEQFFFGVEEITYAHVAEYIVYLIKEKKRNKGFVYRTIHDIYSFYPIVDNMPAFVSAVMRQDRDEWANVDNAKKFLSVIKNPYIQAAAALFIIGHKPYCKNLIDIKASEYDPDTKVLSGKKLPPFVADYINNVIDITAREGGDKEGRLFWLPRKYRSCCNTTELIDTRTLIRQMRKAQVKTGFGFYDRSKRLARGVMQPGLIRYGQR